MTYLYRLSDGSATGTQIEYHLLRRLSTAGYPIISDGIYDTASWCQPPQGGFDGDLNTYVDSDQNLWPKVGVDFGAATNFVALVRAYPRKNQTGRFNGFKAYGGSDWTKADKCKALTAAVNSSAGEVWYVLPADFSTAYRYYFYSDCYGGNCAECEFYGWSQADIDANSKSDVELTVTRSDWTDSYAVLAWDSAVGAVDVQRREGVDGNWVTLQTGVTGGAYTDRTLKFGVLSYFRLKIGDAYTDAQPLLRMHKLAVAAEQVFIQTDVGNPLFGADFGRADTSIAFCRVLPATGQSGRVVNVVLSGSTRKSSVIKTGNSVDTIISAPVSAEDDTTWIEFDTTSTAAFRSFYLNCADLAEVEFYGWTLADQGKSYVAPKPEFKVADNVPAGSAARPDFTPLFTWNGAATDDGVSVVIQSATKSSEGPWRHFADVAGAESHLGLEARIGVPTWYRLVIDGAPAGAVVSYRRLRELDPNDPKQHCTLFNQGNGDAWGHHTIELAFDRDTSTYADINYKDQRQENIFIAQGKVKDAWDGYKDEDLAVPKMGADYGEAINTVAAVCIFPRDMGNLGRMLKARVYGSNNDAATEVATDEPATMISADKNLESMGVSYHPITIPSPATYRTFYVDEVRYGDLSEIVFYGWSERDLAGPQGMMVIIR